MDLKKKNSLKGICAFASIFLMILSAVMVPVFVSDSFSMVVVVGTVLFCAFAILLVDFRRLNVYKYRLMYYIPVLAVGVSFLINGLLFKVVGYIAIGLVFAVILPFVHKCLSSNDTGNACLIIAKGVVFCFISFYILSVMFGPSLEVDQYTSFLANPNIIGCFASITVASLVFLLLQCKGKNNKSFYVWLLILGISISMCFFSYSRTNMLAILLQLFVVIILEAVSFFRDKERKPISRVLKKGIAILLIMTVGFAVFYLSLQYNKTIFPFTLEDFFLDGDEIVSEIGGASDDKVSFLESMQVGEERFGKGLEEKDSYAFTSGRTMIWNTYLKKITVLGHEKESLSIALADRVIEDTNAHNVYLQVAYSAGIVAGIALFIYVAIMGVELMIRNLKFIIKGDKLSNELIFLEMAFFAFAVSSLTSAGYMMFTYLPATLFWMLSYVISMKEKN